MCDLAQEQKFQDNMPTFFAGTHIFARGTICAPCKAMCAPAQAQNFQNNMNFSFFFAGTHHSARDTICAPSKNMCAPAKAQIFKIICPYFFFAGTHIFLLGAQLMPLAKIFVPQYKQKNSK